LKPAILEILIVSLFVSGCKKVADNGSNWYISGAPDSRWDDDELLELKTIQGNNFEVVKMGTIIPMSK
jgi:hypothetical protein